MSKYVYFNMNGSHGMILSQVKQKPNNMVLEMGCSTGYMTKYLHEELNCIVHVVEIDSDACKQAAKYAHDYYIGDLERDPWKAYYSQYKYDYILFADVLEHLTNPSKVLEQAVELLKDDGRVIISIPNICHNDILMQLFYNHWNYTGLGLLDNTHLRFWGKDELRTLVNSKGLMVESWNEVVIPTFGTEQRPAFKVDEVLVSLLRNREDGEVYQWIVTCKKG